MSIIFQKNAAKYLDSIETANFEDAALQLFHYQYSNNAVYASFVDALKVNVAAVSNIKMIPFMPVSMFRNHVIFTGQDMPGNIKVFESSTTTSDIPGRHFVKDTALYDENSLRGFRQFYGEPEDYVILALLPSYLQRKGASLLHMAQLLITESRQPESGFYLDEFDKLKTVLETLEQEGKKVLLLGVTFALLDFAERIPMQLKHTTIMETGGMKGRRSELTRGEVHDFLKDRLGVSNIHSEYGMTELLSQAYAVHDGIFNTTKFMKVLVRDVNDPLDVAEKGSGCINIIDLANVYSCAFIATDDMGRIYEDDSFEVLGRADNSILRGCNLMVV